MNYRWIIIVAFIWLGLILLDEFSYRYWRVANPGSQYTGVLGELSTLVDPNNPPTTYTQ